MPEQSNFELQTYSDGILTVGMAPPINIGGIPITFTLSLRYNGTPFVTKSCNSGFGGGQSGIVVTDSGQGVFSVIFTPAEVSGKPQNSYYFRATALVSGQTVPVAEGYRLMT